MAVTNPLGSLVEGLLQGHQLGLQLKRAQMEEEAFKTNQALHQQQLTTQEIMNEQRARQAEMDIRGLGGREVVNGMIQEPATTVPGMQRKMLGQEMPAGLPVPEAQPVAGIVRKPGGNGRFVVPLRGPAGERKQFEMPSAEEQQSAAIRRELQVKTELARGEAVAQQDIALEMRKRMLSTPGQTIPAPPGLEIWGYQAGDPVLKSEIGDLTMKMQAFRKGGNIDVAPGHVIVNENPIFGAPQAAAQPGYGPGEFGDLQKAGAVQGPPGPAARWEALTTRRAAPAGGPAATGAANAAGAGMRVVARGGEPLPTDDFGKYFLGAYARDKGKKIGELTHDEVAEARAEFSGETRNPTEASLAWNAIHEPNPLKRAQYEQALKRLDQSKREARPVTNILNSDTGRAAIETAAQTLASGDTTRLRDIAGMRGGERLLIFNRAKQLNPNFSPAEVDRKIKMEDYYANGQGADNLRSFGTFLEHGGAALDAINGISTTNSRFINKSVNWWRKNMSGSPEYVNLVGALEPVRKEFEGFLLGGRALHADDKAQAKIILDDDSSLSQVQSALKRMGHTAEARFNEENFRYKKLMKRDLPDPFSPEAMEGARKIGVKLPGTAGAGTAGSGHVIDIEGKQYQYKGSGDTGDLKNYTELAK